MKKALQFSLFLFALLTFGTKSFAQVNNHKIHSIFIYNFAKYTQWPASVKSGDFVIEVLGRSPLADELERVVANKMVGTQKIVVRRVTSPDQVSASHMVVVPATESRHFETVQARLKGKPSLLITEKPGLGQKGSGINFVIREDKWSYELNQASLAENGLKVSVEISKLAINI
jgi:hypothetical protein